MKESHSSDKIKATDTKYSKLAEDAVFTDQPFSFDDWRVSRNQPIFFKRYWTPCLFLRILMDIWKQVFCALAISVVVGTYHFVLVSKKNWPWIHYGDANAMEIGIPWTSTSFAVALLLVFMTTECYRRWWEGRRCMGRLNTCMRNLVRQAMAWFQSDSLLEAMARWCIVLSHMPLVHVCEKYRLEDVLKDMLRPEELEFLSQQERPTFGVAACMTYIVHAAGLSNEQETAMDLDIRAALQNFGLADDILRQPLPTPHARLGSWFLLAWICALPIAIWNVFGWMTPVICTVIAFFLFAIEDISIQIEEPFSRLPLDKLAERLRKDINEMMQHRHDALRLVELCNVPGQLHGPQSPWTSGNGHCTPLQQSIASGTMQQQQQHSNASVIPQQQQGSANGSHVQHRQHGNALGHLQMQASMQRRNSVGP